MNMQKLALAALISTLSLPVLAEEGGAAVPAGQVTRDAKMHEQAKGVATPQGQDMRADKHLRNEQRKAQKGARKAEKNARKAGKALKAEAETVARKDQALLGAGEGQGHKGHHEGKVMGADAAAAQAVTAPQTAVAQAAQAQKDAAAKAAHEQKEAAEKAVRDQKEAAEKVAQAAKDAAAQQRDAAQAKAMSVVAPVVVPATPAVPAIPAVPATPAK